MTKHFSTAIIALASALGFIFLGLPFYGTSAVKTSGYGALGTDPSIFGGDRAASLSVIKIAIIVLIVLFSLTLIYSLIKLLIDLNVIKIKNTSWTEWIYIALLALMTIFSLVVVWASTVHCAAANGWAEYKDWLVQGTGVKFMYLKLGVGCVVAMLVYGIVLGLDIAWAILLPKIRVWFGSGNSAKPATKPAVATSDNKQTETTSKPVASAPAKQNAAVKPVADKKPATSGAAAKSAEQNKATAKSAPAKPVAAKPASKPATKSAPAPAKKPAAKPASKPATKSAPAPAKKPAAKKK